MTTPERVLLNAILRAEFTAFLQRCFLTLNPRATFLPNWHIDALAYRLELVRRGEILRLIVNMPPRSLKSIICSVAFPAFMLGHDPTKRVIAVSYSADLAIKHANDFRAVVTAPWYQRIFPGMRISPTKNTESEVISTQHGYRLATSVDGTLTGRGGDVVIIDDPLKPVDALSESKRERVNHWFNNTLLSRLDDKQTGAIIVVMQRLHKDDLAGTLLRSSSEWTPLTLAAIAEQEEKIQVGADKYHTRHVGDVLHPEREPSSVLDSMRSQIGSSTFAAQWQQAPLPPEGVMIKREWVGRYERLPEHGSESQVIQSWDTASKPGAQSDYTVCTTWLYHGKKYYLVHVFRDRIDYPTLKARAIALASEYKAGKILIEDAGVGTALVLELQRAGLPAIAVKPVLDKQTRMAVQAGKFESGQVLFPEQAAWLDPLEAELFAFPSGAHDDQVDSISQALAHEISTYDPYTDEAIKGLQRFTEALLMDQYWGRVTGRPW